MAAWLMPVTNGILPRPGGGLISGLFANDGSGQLPEILSSGTELLVCPLSVETSELYPIGVLGRIVEVQNRDVQGSDGKSMKVAMVVIEGQEHIRWRRLKRSGYLLSVDEAESVDFKAMRSDYPVVSGAGWIPQGGFTEFRGADDIPVTVYGQDLMTGQQVSIRGNLRGLTTPEQAHTIEHSLIRSLHTFGLCTAKTLHEAMQMETVELKKSLERSFRFNLPETIGVTASGACGNPMTNLARFYLGRQLADNLGAGQNLASALGNARRKTMSKLVGDLSLTTDPSLRVMQGLKKGMAHDDSKLKLDLCKNIVARFPFDPWS